ncbi:hypothetical protein KFE94_17080 [bacterium SCSIO 12643]|nr:hypothetical protein KFE94_17080 [bacterium SCSIO 12643]
MKINTSLKHILIANSIFTGMSSATFILFSDVLAHLYLVDAFIIKIIGIGLIIFLVQLIWLLKSENSWIRIQWIIFQYFACILESIKRSHIRKYFDSVCSHDCRCICFSTMALW